MSRTNDHNPLDRAIDLVAAETPDPQLVEQAAARVWERLSRHPEQLATSPAELAAPTAPMAATPAPIAQVTAMTPQAPMAPMTPLTPITPLTPMASLAPKAPLAPMAPMTPLAPMAPMAPMAPKPAADAAASSSHPAPLHRCEDFQALLPAYLRGELSPARALLLEDHTRSCVPCRRALREARQGHVAAAGPDLFSGAGTHPPGRQRAVWLALAAMLVAALGAGLFLLTGPAGGRMARVQSIEGSLYQVSGASSVPVGAGDAVTQGETIRTAKGSRALVRMNDGSLIEMSERAGMALHASRGGNIIALERGRIIVQAAKQRPRHLFVATGDCRVSVTGTVFAVNRGTKGSRVSVIEGEVRVQQARFDSLLHPGDQVTTHPSVAAVPVRQEIAWSRDAARYQTMLAALAGAGREIDQQVAQPGLRSSTRLLDLSPAATGVYIALPNLTGNLTDTQRLLDQRLAQNDELRQWWSGSFGTADDEARYQTLMQEIGDLGHYLGDEIAFTLPLAGGGAGGAGPRPGDPLLLAAVTNEASFRATLAQEVDKVNTRAGHPVLVLVSDPAAAVATDRQVLLWEGKGVFAATHSPAALAEVAGYAAGGANAFVASAFRARIADAYNDGAGWLFASDLSQILGAQQSLGDSQKILSALGIDGLEHFILNYRGAPAGGEARAALTFSGPRRGVASWLAAPAPMGSLDFFSPDANLVVAFVVKSPVALLDQLLSTSPDFAAELAKAEAKYHFDLRSDLAQPLGGEIALGVDGPLLPTPSWKLVAEVYDPVKLQQTFSRAATELDQSLRAEGKPGVTLSQEQSGGLTYYALVATDPAVEIHYVFTDGYLVAAPSRALLDQALSLKSSGVSLASSRQFHDLLGQDGQVNVSALFYRNLGSLGSLAGALPAMAGALPAMTGAGAAATTPQGHHHLNVQAGGGPSPLGAMLAAASGPSLFYAYAEDSRILFGGKNQPGPLGANLQALAGFRTLLAGMQEAHGEAAAQAAQEPAR